MSMISARSCLLLQVKILMLSKLTTLRKRVLTIVKWKDRNFQKRNFEESWFVNVQNVSFARFYSQSEKLTERCKNWWSWKSELTYQWFIKEHKSMIQKTQHYIHKILKNRLIDSILEYIYSSNFIISKDKQYCSFIQELIWKEKREKGKILSIELWSISKRKFHRS